MRDRLKRYYTTSEFGDLSHAAIQPMNKHLYPVHIREEGSKSKGVECIDALDLITQADYLFDLHPRAILEVFKLRRRRDKPGKPAHKKHHR